jgi:hypothetical protein
MNSEMHNSQLELQMPGAVPSAPVAENRLLPASAVDKGAHFSQDRKYRYALWRIWDKSKPLVMFVGLNPSTANEDENDATIRSVERLSKNNGYGGFYMMNCFAYISTNPKGLIIDIISTCVNDNLLEEIGLKCKDVVFAWGSFSVVKETGRDAQLSKMFPNAKVLFINKNGSPKHPLYCKTDTVFVNWQSGSSCR